MITKRTIIRKPSYEEKGISVNRRYLGSKARLIDWVVSILGKPRTRQNRFVDIFSGTGVVSRATAELGWSVLANDHLRCAAIMTQAQLATRETSIFRELGGYQNVIDYLNTIPGKEGFIYREYSPSNLSYSGHKRLYFTQENAARIDAIRVKIKEWQENGFLSSEEEALLIADLMNAADSVANTAGTYGCFLKRWQTNALQPLKVNSRKLLEKRINAEVTCKDVKYIESLSCDVVYIDPPYTKRQYAAYYHILETIAWGDEPLVDGVTGLRHWQDKSSDFCYKMKAEQALRDVLLNLKSRRILLSYSSEGHMSTEKIMEILGDFGNPVLHLPKHIPRYKANGNGFTLVKSVRELLFEVRR